MVAHVPSPSCSRTFPFVSSLKRERRVVAAATAVENVGSNSVQSKMGR